MDIRYFRSIVKDEEQLHHIIKIKDQITLVEKTAKVYYSSFLDPAVRALTEPLLQSDKTITYRFFGGYDYAERTVLAIGQGSENLDANENFPFCLLKIKNNKFSPFSHRDVLGAVLNLGIEREVMGDIVFDGDACYFFLHKDMASFVIHSLTKIKRGGVKVEEVFDKDIPFETKEPKEVFLILSSLRLDTLIAKGFRLGRNDAKEYIQAGKVKVNFLEERRPDIQAEEGIWISVRGYGRLQIKEIQGLSKKGSYKVLLSTLL